MKTYKQGKQIKTLDELFSYKVVYVSSWKKSKNTGFLMAWPYRTLMDSLRRGVFFAAERVEPEGLEMYQCNNCLYIITEDFTICPQCGAIK